MQWINHLLLLFFFVFTIDQNREKIFIKALVFVKVVYSPKVIQFGSNLQKRCQIALLSTIQLDCRYLRESFKTFFGDLSQSKKISKVKPPLVPELIVESGEQEIQWEIHK